MSRKADVPAVFAWVSGGYLSAISTTAHLLCHAHSRITDYKAQSDGFALVNIHLAAAQSRWQQAKSVKLILSNLMQAALEGKISSGHEQLANMNPEHP